jgi:hypothetical protein
VERGLVVKNAATVPVHVMGATIKHTFILHHRRFAPAVRLGAGAALQVGSLGHGCRVLASTALPLRMRSA